MSTTPLTLREDRLFGPDAQQRDIAMRLYGRVANLPLICPHGHVDPRMFADPNYQFGSPADLLIIPDHYITRMLYSQGISMEALGIPQKQAGEVASETDHRKVWQTFADHFYLFRGTPTGLWLGQELYEVFGVRERLTSESAQRVYDHIAAQLERPEFRPRQMFEQFNIEVLATTDAATDTLAHHQALRTSGWAGRIIPTFRPDAVVNIDRPDWNANIDRLGELVGRDLDNFPAYLQAIETRRAFFKTMGAQATDHAALTPYTGELTDNEARIIFQHARQRRATEDDTRRFVGHMLMEMARMSIEDGMVMQLHPGSFRNHNPQIYDHFGPDMGADIPIATEYTRNLQPLLAKYGNDSRLTLILFMLDESTLSRELAPLAGHYPALRLGPPWWFFDSVNGMLRFRELVTETAGIYNTVGFNDDTRAFPSIPARHDVARRVDAHWLSGLVARGMLDFEDAEEMIVDLAYGLPKQAYKV